MYKLHFDPVDGILEVRARGLWTPEAVDRYLRDLARTSIEARARAGRLKLLFDGSEFDVQSQETTARLTQFDRVAVHPGDRVAVLLASSLLKLQARRVLAGWQNLELFMSENAARTWLTAGDPAACVERETAQTGV